LCSTVPFSVGMSPVSMMSFRRPVRVQRADRKPERLCSSAARACLRVLLVEEVQACTCGSTARMRSRHDCTSSSE